MTKPKRILFIDDHSDLAVVFSRMLDRRGYNSTPALTVDDGIAQARMVEFDLVVCDIVFAEKSGFQFLNELREFSSVPTIAISGVYDKPEEARKAGFANFLAKPLLLGNLVDAIEDIFSAPTLGHA